MSILACRPNSTPKGKKSDNDIASRKSSSPYYPSAVIHVNVVAHTSELAASSKPCFGSNRLAFSGTHETRVGTPLLVAYRYRQEYTGLQCHGVTRFSAPPWLTATILLPRNLRWSIARSVAKGIQSLTIERESQDSCIDPKLLCGHFQHRKAAIEPSLHDPGICKSPSFLPSINPISRIKRSPCIQSPGTLFLP
jgi:hypothetical protein